MKPVLRIAAASIAGLLAGWGVRTNRTSEAPAPGTRLTQMLPVNPAPPAVEAWRQRLDVCAPLAGTDDAGAFWDRMAPAGARSRVEWQLALDEAFLTLPREALLAVLQDERFSSFPRLYEAEESAAWSRKLLSLGLDTALLLSGKMPAKWLNVHLENALLEAFAKEDPERGFAWALESGRNNRALLDFFEQVATQDARKALLLFSRLESGDLKNAAAGSLLQSLAMTDWKAAVTFGQSHFTPEEWRRQIPQLFNGFYGAKLTELYLIAGEITDPEVRSAAYSHAVFWPYSDSDSTLDRALALPAGTLNVQGWSEVGSTCGSRAESFSPGPAEAAAKLRALAQRVPETGRTDFMNGALGVACLNYPAFAAEFYDTLTSRNVERLAKTWTNQDPVAASAWLATLPPSESRETALAAFCREGTPVDPSGAATWALELQNPEVRASLVQAALTAWRQKDAAQADAWAGSHGGAAQPD